MSALSPFREDLEQLGPFETIAPDSAGHAWEAEPEWEDSAWESEVGGAGRLSGPAIGPMHGKPLTSELRRGVAADAAELSPLAITLRGLRRAPYLQRGTIAAIVVHNTSRGPANRSRKGGYRHPAVHYALNYYIDGDGGFPHYVIDFNGTIYATCDERRIAHHAGWVHHGGAKLFKTRWTAPRWWARVWSPQGAATPLHLLPKGARSPNHRTIGVELLILPDLSYTPEQYRALARLVVDIQRRNPDVHIPSAPSRGLLGHEDFAPVTGKGGRADAKGGWDPGAHREKPYFDWQRLWAEVQAVAPGFGAAGARELELGPFEAHVPDFDEAWKAEPEWQLAEEDPGAVDETRDEDAETFDPEAVDESWEAEAEAPRVRTTPYPASALRWPGATDAQLAFMRAVYELMVKRAQAPSKTRSGDWVPGRSFIGDLPKKSLAQIEPGHWARKDAAAKARELLAAARADLAADGLADRVKIGIISAYRSAAQQWYIWQGLNPDGSPRPGRGFPHYYALAAARRRRLGDEHGPQAVKLQATYMGKYIAAPGFSDHNNGIAIDFGTGSVGKRGLGKIGNRAWFHRWLVANAARFDFVPLPSEPWHWEYQPSKASSGEAEDGAWMYETEPLSEAPWSESDPELEDEVVFEDELEDEIDFESEFDDEDEVVFEDELEDESEFEDEDELAFEDELEDGGELESEQAVGGVRPGLLDVDRVALLASHRGSGPALRLRWNAMPSAVQEVDVVVHLHGYGGRKMTVAGFERSSGLDLGPVDGVAGAGRSRPTLTVLPRGHMTGRRARRARPGKPPPDFFAYTFPALLHRDGLPKLVAFALERFAAQAGASAPPRIGRLILTAHSGGGAALLRNLEHHADKVDEVYAFDALYQDAGALARWAKSRMKRDRSQGATPGGAMRVFYGRSTRRHSEVLLEAIRRDIGSDPDLRARYRVEASTLGHWQIPRQYGWRVLADAGADVPSIQTTRGRSSRELEDWIAESEALEDPRYGEGFEESWHEDEHLDDDEALGDTAMLQEWVAEDEDASHAFAEAPDAEIEWIPQPELEGIDLDEPDVALALNPEWESEAGAPVGLRNWPRILPLARRDRRTAITVTKGNDFANVPPIEVPELNSEQRSIFEQIKANRATLPDYPLKKRHYKGNWGYALGESGAGEGLVPQELRAGSGGPEIRAKRIAWKEVGHEGRLDSINTYDNQILTWGKGFSARSGSMNEVLEIMFKRNPQAKELMLRAGIDCARDPRSWKVVNGTTGMIETGENALRLLQFDRKLLGVFVTLGRDPKHRQHALEAQWQALTKPGRAAAVPRYAWGWSKHAIALAAHLSHWTPAFGWGRNDYSRTGGDLVNIVGAWARAARRIRKWAKTLPNRAIIAPADIMQPGHRLRAFAGGAGGRAVSRRATVVTGTPAQLGTDPRYAGHVLLPVFGKPHKYYDLGMAGA